MNGRHPGAGIAKASRRRQPRAVVFPPFGPAGACPDEWEAYVKKNAGKSDVAAFEPPQRAVDVECPPATLPTRAWRDGMSDPSTRVVNVQEPWASLLARGVKDVENRSRRYPGTFLVLVSSKPSFSAPEWAHRVEDARRRVAWHEAVHPTPPSPTSPVEGRQELYVATAQHALALLRVESVCNASASLRAKQSIWNNGDAFAWRVTHVRRLLPPVFVGAGSLGLPYLNRPAKDGLRAAIALQLESDCDDGTSPDK